MKKQLKLFELEPTYKIRSWVSNSLESRKASFLAQSRKIHSDINENPKYNYDLVDYVDSYIPVKIICPRHGSFVQKPTIHLNSNGCKICGIEDRSVITRESGKAKFLEKALKIHINKDGDPKYNYDLVDYKSNNFKVKIICSVHGTFEQIPGAHLNGHGCPKCSIVKRADTHRKPKEELLKELKTIWGDKYIFPLDDYIGCADRIKVICPKHGEFTSTPTILLGHHGYKTCGDERRISQRTIYKEGNKDELIKKCQQVLGDNFEIRDITFGNTKTAKIKTYCKTHKKEGWQPISQVILYGYKACTKCAYEERERTNHKNFSANNKCLSESESPVIHENLKEWDYSKNAHYSPDNLTEGSDRLVWWKCSRCGHEYQMTLRLRVRMMYHYCEDCNPVSLNRSSLPSNIIFYELKKILVSSEIRQEYKKEFSPFSWDMRIVFNDGHIVYTDYDGRYHLSEKNKKGDKKKNILGVNNGGEVWRIIEYPALLRRSEGVYYTQVDGNRFMSQAKKQVNNVINDLSKYFINHLTDTEQEKLTEYLPLIILQNEMELFNNFRGNRLDRDILYRLRIQEKKTLKEILNELEEMGISCSMITLSRNLRFYKIKLDKDIQGEVFKRLPSKRKIPISQWTLEGEHVADFISINYAVKHIKNSSIAGCLSGRYKTAGGFLWTRKGEAAPHRILES